MKRNLPLILALICLFALTACQTGLLPGETSPTPTQEPVATMETVVVQTMSVRQTIAFLETQIARSTTQAPPSPTVNTSTPAPHTATPTLGPTVTPFPSVTPGGVVATATSVTPCNAALFVTDVTYPDGTVVAPEQTLLKTWRLKNAGTCAWTTTYALVFASGSQLGGSGSVNLPMGVKPGETVDLSVTLRAPKDAGAYTGYWQLRASDGQTFGTGAKNQPFWVKIQVGATTMSGTNLINNMCNAVWKSATASLPCPASRADFQNGSVLRVDNPKLEGGYQDNEPALVMIPNDGTGGKITGVFPAYTVQTGDEFVTLWGCMDNSPKCNVTFTLSYTIDGVSVTDLLTWNHAYTGSGGWKKVDVLLTSLAGKSVKFILTVGNYDGKSVDDQAFWLAPQIKH